MIGGYLTPPALSTGEDHPWILFGYVFLLNAGALLLARMRRWKALEPIAAAATILLYAAWFSRWFGDANRPVATVFAFAFYAQFSVATLSELWAVFRLTRVALLWRSSGKTTATLSGGIFSSSLADSCTLPEIWSAPLWTLVCFWLPFWIWYSPDAPFAALSAAFLIFFAWALWRRADEPAGLGTDRSQRRALLCGILHAAEPGTPPVHGPAGCRSRRVHLLLARHYESRSDAQTLTLGVALAFVTLAVPIQFAGFRVTIAWALEGAVLAWLSARSHSDWLRAACWAVLTLALVRLLALDTFIYSQSSEYSTLLNTRFLTFAVSTAALWLAARFLAPARDAAVAYIAGHAVLLFGLSLEIGGWVSRNVVPENQSSVQIVAISVMLTIYAVILVLIGVRTQAAIHRIAGARPGRAGGGKAVPGRRVGPGTPVPHHRFSRAWARCCWPSRISTRA